MLSASERERATSVKVVGNRVEDVSRALNALAAGISEALVNTALGIGTSFIAMLAYNFFTTIIDNITFGIDESGFTLEQSFKANYK